MLRKAAAIGVPVDTAVADTLLVDATVPVGRNKDPRADPFRKVRAVDWSHHTITIRNEPACQNPPKASPRETDAFERTRVSLPRA